MWASAINSNSSGNLTSFYGFQDVCHCRRTCCVGQTVTWFWLSHHITWFPAFFWSPPSPPTWCSPQPSSSPSISPLPLCVLNSTFPPAQYNRILPGEQLSWAVILGFTSTLDTHQHSEIFEFPTWPWAKSAVHTLLQTYSTSSSINPGWGRCWRVWGTYDFDLTQGMFMKPPSKKLWATWCHYKAWGFSWPRS